MIKFKLIDFRENKKIFEEDDIIHLVAPQGSICPLQRYTKGRNACFRVNYWNFDEQRQCCKGFESIEESDNYYQEKLEESKIQGLQYLDISINEIYKDLSFYKKFYRLVPPKEDYPKQKVPIDPYFFGLWLGDGTSENTSITSIDKEIIDFIYEYAEKLGLSVNNNKLCYSITTGSNINKNACQD